MINWIKKLLNKTTATPVILPEEEVVVKAEPKKSRGRPKKINKIEPKDK